MIKRKVRCPDCGEITVKREWYDKYSKVEEDIKCDCGHHYNWSYGHITIDKEGDHDDT